MKAWEEHDKSLQNSFLITGTIVTGIRIGFARAESPADSWESKSCNNSCYLLPKVIPFLGKGEKMSQMLPYLEKDAYQCQLTKNKLLAQLLKNVYSASQCIAPHLCCNCSSQRLVIVWLSSARAGTLNCGRVSWSGSFTQKDKHQLLLFFSLDSETPC